MHHSLELVNCRNYFYYQQYRKMFVLLLILCLVLMANVFVLVKEFKTRGQPVYLLTNANGTPVLDEPVHLRYPDRRVLDWVQSTVPDICSFDFVNYIQLFYSKRIYFTVKGLQDFIQALVNSANLESVKQRRQVVYAEIRGTPRIQNMGQLFGHFTWLVSLPMRLKYENAAGEILIQNGIARINVIRGDVLLTVNNSGLAIHQFVFEETKDNAS